MGKYYNLINNQLKIKKMKLSNEELLKIINSETAVIDFSAEEWCAPCKVLGPIINKLSEKYSDSVKICKINIDENSELTEKYGIQSIPTILFFKNGNIVDKSIGMIQQNKLEEKIVNLINLK